MNKPVKKVKKVRVVKKATEYEKQEIYLKKLLELYEREKQTRCYFQLERDKLTKLREIEKTKYDEMKDQFLVVSDKLAKMEYAHNQEMTTMSRKVQYLISEHQIKTNELKIQLNNKSNVTLNETIDKDNAYLNNIRKNINELNEKCLNYDELIKNITNDYENQISKLKFDFSESIKDVQKASSSKYKDERENFSLVTRNALNELNELKNEQITSMIQIKNKSFDEMRDYFQKLTRNLAGSVEKLQKRNTLIEKNLKEKQAKLDKCGKELEETKNENLSLKEKLKSLSNASKLFQSENKIYKAKSNEFETLSQQNKELDLKYEELLYNFEKIKLERDDLSGHLTNLGRMFKEKLDIIKFISNRKNKLMQCQLLVNNN